MVLKTAQQIKKAGGNTYYAVLAGAAVLAAGELCLLWRGVFDGMPFADYTIGHLATFALSSGLALVAYRQGWDHRFALLQLVLLGVLGPFGALTFLIVVPQYFWYNRVLDGSDDLVGELFLEKETFGGITQHIYERVIYGYEDKGAQSVPLGFIDLLYYGSERQKRGVIERILKFFRPEFSPCLEVALKNTHLSIRSLAATAVIRVEMHYAKKMQELLDASVEDQGNLDNILAVANYAVEFFSLSFLEEDKAKRIRFTAIEFYSAYLEVRPTDTVVLCALARLYYTEGDYEGVIERLGPLIGNEGVLPSDAYRWYVAALFKLKRYRDVRGLAQGNIIMGGDSFDYDRMMDILVLWRRGYKVEADARV